MMSYVFVARKGLVETHLMPYLDLETKLFILPSVNRDIRRFFTNPTHDRLLFNILVAPNFYSYA